jgi:hypothetical protein
MTVTYVEDADAKTVELTVSGRITREDFDAIVAPMQAFIDTHGSIRMVEVVESMGGFDPSVIWEGIQFDFRNIRHISHVAVVSDIGWISPMSKAAGALIATKLRTFAMSEVDEARVWARTAD